MEVQEEEGPEWVRRTLEWSYAQRALTYPGFFEKEIYRADRPAILRNMSVMMIFEGDGYYTNVLWKAQVIREGIAPLLYNPIQYPVPAIGNAGTNQKFNEEGNGRESLLYGFAISGQRPCRASTSERNLVMAGGDILYMSFTVNPAINLPYTPVLPTTTSFRISMVVEWSAKE